MKASDFATTSREREEAVQNLIRTEETDAVNTGIVDSAGKRGGSALKGASAARGAVRGGATNAALAAISKGGGKHTGGSVDSEVAPAMSEGASVTTGGSSLKTKLRGGAKGAAKGLAVKGVHSQLEGTELEGADDLYYRGRTGYRLAKYAKGRLSAFKAKRSLSLSGRDGAATAGKPLGGLSERRAKVARNTVGAKRKAQMTRYFKRSVYSSSATTVAQAGVKKGTVAVANGGVKGLLSALGSASAPLLLGIVVVALVLSLIASLAGGLAEEERKSASMDGMPAWVTYDLVLACLEARDEYGYPASAMLGQMMIENGTSDNGSSLGRLYHNYGGVKYAGYDYGGLITDFVNFQTTEYTAGGTAYTTYANFAVFASDEAYMTYRCEYLYKQSNYTSQPNFQKAIDNNDSELFLQALGEGGYYTAPVSEYLASYRSICNAYPLVPALDSMTVEEFESRYSGTSGGQDYASAEQWQKNIVNACKTTPWPGKSLCATWTTRVYAAAGYSVHGNGNSQLGSQGYGASYYPSRATTDLSQIQVGMLVSAQYGSNTSAGNTYGHVGIYIGDGMVMDSVSSGIRTISLSDWVSQNNRGWVVCGYPWDWR